MLFLPPSQLQGRRGLGKGVGVGSRAHEMPAWKQSQGGLRNPGRPTGDTVH